MINKLKQLINEPAPTTSDTIQKMADAPFVKPRKEINLTPCDYLGAENNLPPEYGAGYSNSDDL